jgi:hypothetical protein
VLAQITPAGSGINPSQTKLFFTKSPSLFTDSVVMTHGTGNNWTANLTLSGAGTYRYYIKTIDSINRVATAPGGAPSVFYSFIASSDTVRPVITHTPLANVPKVSWPVSVYASVTDNIGVDSVWVRWYKNNTGTGIKHFKLLPTGGSNYSAVFNSVNADVAVGDSIFYRIFARDISAAHNVDSTVLNQFKIINLVTVCLGTGTVAMGSSSGPYNTYWWGNRTNILWTAAELTAAGATAGYINQIGFQVSVASSQAMNGLTFRFQNTTATTLSAFVSTGWTQAYTGTYTVPGTGWQYVTMTTPYYWNGTSNLLCEVCFGNTSYSTATTVLGTTMSGMERTEYHDLSTACAYTGFTGGTNQSARANTCFVISPLMGVTPGNTGIPSVYELAQNYPNPFNPTTKINFAIPKQGLVTLKVYDVLGREVANLVNEVKTAGNYIVDFDASYLSSGVYFYKLEVNGFSDVKRLMLIK